MTNKSNRYSRAVKDNVKHRFELTSNLRLDDGWWQEQESSADTTELIEEKAKSIISTNRSPDVPFNRSINPYRGCEHGCVYCYARPTHAYWDFSPGYDFESKIIYKPNAAELLEKKFNSPNYQCEPIVIGANTDAYQPAEKEKQVTRDLLNVFIKYRHPVSIITKGQLIGRDLDLLSQLANFNLVSVAVSVTTLKNSLKGVLEPRAASPITRLKAIKQLAEIGVPVTALVAPIIPAINDEELESILENVSANGAINASYILLRLPYEVEPIFVEWLETHFPLRKQKVLNYLQQIRGGKLNQSEFGKRMSGEGPFAEAIKQRFKLACNRNGLSDSRRTDFNLNTKLFRNTRSNQLDLFRD